MLLKRKHGSQTNRGNTKCREISDLGEKPFRHVDIKVFVTERNVPLVDGVAGMWQGAWEQEKVTLHFRTSK